MDTKKIDWSKVTLYGGVIACSICAIVLMISIMSMSYNNRAIELENLAVAQQEANKTTYDTVWKTIKQKAQISEKYESQFKNVYSNIMQERKYDKGGEMFKFLVEHNPQFDSSLLQDLGNTIEGQRIRFETSQKLLIDIKREHDNLRQFVPSKWFIGKRPSLNIQIITSIKTEDVFKSTKDDDVNLFK